jgi:serine phosphatase RsbU (regulator of sigma subunit)
MTAGRLAAELERAMLITAQVESTEALRQIDAARRLQQGQWPQPIRLAEEGWELAGRTLAAGQLSGAFYDWYWLPGDALAIMIGEAGQSGLAGALTAAALRSAIRTYVEEGLAPGELIERVNRSLWFTSGGDESATLLCGIIELPTGRLRYAWAGQPSAIRLSSKATEIALASRPPLGATTDAQFAEQSLELAPGETLILAGSAIGGVAMAHATPAELLEALAQRDRDPAPTKQDRAMLAIKRTIRPGDHAI